MKHTTKQHNKTPFSKTKPRLITNINTVDESRISIFAVLCAITNAMSVLRNNGSNGGCSGGRSPVNRLTSWPTSGRLVGREDTAITYQTTNISHVQTHITLLQAPRKSTIQKHYITVNLQYGVIKMSHPHKKHENQQAHCYWLLSMQHRHLSISISLCLSVCLSHRFCARTNASPRLETSPFAPSSTRFSNSLFCISLCVLRFCRMRHIQHTAGGHNTKAQKTTTGSTRTRTHTHTSAIT